MAEPAAAVAIDRPPPPDLFGHPRGLWVLAGTELWERISFHGMQALLTLYMAGVLLLPGRAENIVGFADYRAAVETPARSRPKRSRRRPSGSTSGWSASPRSSAG